jgi:hypothetical protein
VVRLSMGQTSMRHDDLRPSPNPVKKKPMTENP